MFDGFAKPAEKPAKPVRRPRRRRGKKSAGGDVEQQSGGCFSFLTGRKEQPLLEEAEAEGNAAEPEAAPTGGLRRLTPHERLERFIDATADRVETRVPRFAECLHTFKPLIAIAIELCFYVVKFYIWLYYQFYLIYKVLPMDEINMITGVLLCFFGGTFEVTIAAVEAFRTMGGQRLYEQLQYVLVQAHIIYEAELKDSELDENHNNIPDVDEIPSRELASRKTKVAMMAIEEPEELQTAVGALWQACISVLAALNMKFAKVTAYALAFADMLRFPVIKVLAPLVTYFLGPELTHWVETVIDMFLRLVCLLVMWYLEKVRAAFYAGLRGGKLFAEGLFDMLARKGWAEKLPDWLVTKPFDPDKSRLDEAIAYPLAFCGMYWQIKTWFHIPFPFDWVLWPVQLLEDTLIALLVWEKVTS